MSKQTALKEKDGLVCFGVGARGAMSRPLAHPLPCKPGLLRFGTGLLGLRGGSPRAATKGRHNEQYQ